MGIFGAVGTITKRKTVTNKAGYIEALLADLDNDGEGILYDDWISLVPILKFELDDEDLAFELFDNFSSQNEYYDEDFTYKKFYEAQLEGDGRLTLGTLVHIAKDSLGDKYDQSRYAKFFGEEEVSRIEEFNQKLKKNKNKLPDHYLPEPIDMIKFPTTVEIDPVLALSTVIMEGETYGTATDPRHCEVIDPYNNEPIQQYITVNPVKGSRKQDNVTHFKYTVVEFDTISLDEQFSILNSIDLPYEALVFTGNKSIHAWVRIDATDINEYKKRTRLIVKMFSDFGYNKEKGNGPDTAVLLDCASLVRAPGIVRVDWSHKGDKSAGNIQKAIWAEESKGWDSWYKEDYPKYVIESSLDDIETENVEFQVPEKEHHFARQKGRVTASEGEEFVQPLIDGLQMTDKDDIEKALLENIPEFFVSYTKRNKKFEPLSISTLYHLFIDACREGGAHYEGDIQEALLNACTNAHKFLAHQNKQRKERAEASVESLKNIDFDGSDPQLLKRIDERIYLATNSEKPEDFENLERSLEDTAVKMSCRPGLLQDPEVYKYSKILGDLLNQEMSHVGYTAHGSLYAYNGLPNYFNVPENNLLPVDVKRFPSIISPYVAVVKEGAKGTFSVVPLDNDSASKLLAAHQFLNTLRQVELISEVPVFKELDNGAELILDYDEGKKTLVKGDSKGYGLIDLEEAKKILVGLFDDFQFVDKSDLSRSVAALLTPALCHSDMLGGGFRPIWYVDADSQGAGKNTLVDFITIPYTDNPAKVTQDDSSIGSIDDKVGSSISSGDNLIILDNLKPTRKMKELSSPFLESLVTSDSIKFRAPTQGNVTLNSANTCLYVTTNGMSMSKDLAQRAMYISIRKKDDAYNFKIYKGGHVNWIKENRPLIMSAIFTIMSEYVALGKPTKELQEKHRFINSTEILNYIIVDIFGLPDVSTGLKKRITGKSDKSIEIVRAICFSVDKGGSLGKDLNNLDIYDLMYHAGNEDVLGLDTNLEIYSDEENTKLTSDAKRAIGQKISSIMSRPDLFGKPRDKKSLSKCTIEEFTLVRSYHSSNKTPLYTVTKDD